MSTNPSGRKKPSSQTKLEAERRVHPRHALRSEITCKLIRPDDETTYPARLVDISAGGIGLLLNQKLAVGTVASIKLQAGQKQKTLRARVVHVTELAPACWLSGCALESVLSPEEVQEWT